MKVFDGNCFLGRPQTPLLKSYPTADSLLRELDDAGIEQAVVSHFRATDTLSSREGNEILMREIAGHDRLHPCWVLNPKHLTRHWTCGDVLKALGDQGVRMVRLQPGTTHSYAMHPWMLEELAEGCTQAGRVLYVDFVTGAGFSNAAVSEAQLEIFSAFVQRFPDLKIIVFSQKLILAMRAMICLMQRYPNIMLDLSSIQRWCVEEEMGEEVGFDRLVFGSWMPFFDPGQFITQLAYSRITADQKEMVASGNLERLLGGGGS